MSKQFSPSKEIRINPQKTHLDFNWRKQVAKKTTRMFNRNSEALYSEPDYLSYDFKEYSRLEEIEQDKLDYESALKVKETNKMWIKHEDLKIELGVSY